MISIPTVGLLPSFCPNYRAFTAAPITTQLFIAGHVTRFEQIPSRVYIDLRYERFFLRSRTDYRYVMATCKLLYYNLRDRCWRSCF